MMSEKIIEKLNDNLNSMRKKFRKLTQQGNMILQKSL